MNGPKRLYLLASMIALQVLSAGYFLFDLLFDVARRDLTGNDTALHSVVEALAVLGLLISVVASLREMRRLARRNARVENQLRAASGAFGDMLQGYFERWELTPSERDVALLVIKGFTNAEIAALRGTKEGTVKAQNNAIFRKADVTNRPQLLSMFIEDLMGEPLVDAARTGASDAVA